MADTHPEVENNSSARASKAGKLVKPARAPEMPVQAYSPSTAISFMNTLASRFDPNELADRLRDLMDAELPPIMTKDGTIITRPDNSTRLRAIEFIFAYVVGRPIERQQIVTQSTGGTMEDFAERLAQSPVLRKTLRGLLDGLDKGE